MLDIDKHVDEHSSLIGKSLVETGLRRSYKVTLLAVKRADKIISNPDRDTRLCANDLLYLLGSPEMIVKVAQLSDGHQKGE